VERSRAQLLASTIYSLDSQFRLAYLFGAAFAVGRSVQDTLGWTDRIKAVTVQTSTRWLASTLIPKRSTTGILLPAPAKTAAAAN
jgi:predicted Zn-dependent peptidase